MRCSLLGLRAVVVLQQQQPLPLLPPPPTCRANVMAQCRRTLTLTKLACFPHPTPTNGHQGEHMAVYRGLLGFLTPIPCTNSLKPCTNSSSNPCTSCRSNQWPTPGYITNGPCCLIIDMGFPSMQWTRTGLFPTPIMVSTEYMLMVTMYISNFPQLLGRTSVPS